jgi:hypothetical protein
MTLGLYPSNIIYTESEFINYVLHENKIKHGLEYNNFHSHFYENLKSHMLLHFLFPGLSLKCCKDMMIITL